MPDYYGLVGGQAGQIISLVRTYLPTTSGHIYLYGWRTDEEIDFPLVQISPLVDTPVLTRNSSLSGQLYMNKMEYHIVYRMLSTGEPSTDFYTLLSSASCIIRGTYMSPDSTTNYQRILVTNVDFDYVSPDINPGVVKEVAVTLQCEGWFGTHG